MHPEEPQPAPTPPAVWTAVVLLLALQATLLLRTAWDKSDTADEAHYLGVSVLQWRGDLTSNCESPALPKWGFALALRLVDGELFGDQTAKGRDPLWSRPLPQTRRNLLAARSTTAAVTVLAGLLLFLCGRRLGGDGVGLSALALWALSPSVLASGSLATLDAWAAASVALASWLALRFFERPGLRRVLPLGLALGLGAACKVTVLGLVPVALAVLAAARRRAAPTSSRLWWLRAASDGGALALGLLLGLWWVYGFRFGVLDPAVLCGKDVEGAAHGALGPLPFTPWIEGLLQQVRHGRTGHYGYLFGQAGFQGWWWFYLAALALKTTGGAQFLAGLRLLAWARRRPAVSALLTDLALLAYPLLLLAVMSAGRTQLGIKYLLPAFPLGILALARGLGDAGAAFGLAGRALFLALLVLGGAESLRVHPHHLMFFNLWAGGPEGGPRYLVVGDDWGQDQRRLAEWQRENRPWRLYYTFYSGKPRHWGVNFEQPPCAPKIGFYALQAVEVHRPKRIGRGCLDWLTVEPPDARLGYSIYLYAVSKERIRRLAAERGRGRPFWSSAMPPTGEPTPDAPDDGSEP
jgi:hypothetical protein